MREGDERSCLICQWLFSPFLLMLEYRVPYMFSSLRNWETL